LGCQLFHLLLTGSLLLSLNVSTLLQYFILAVIETCLNFEFFASPSHSKWAQQHFLVWINFAFAQE
jgi:hypothetical protein